MEQRSSKSMVNSKKYLLVIARYNDYRQEFFEKHISPRNKEYCALHGYEYIEITEELKPIRGKLGWIKPFKIQELMNTILKNDDIITCFDADIAIVQIDKEFIPAEGKSFAYAIDSGNTHCMGAYSIRVNEWSRRMIDLMVSDERYNTLGHVVTQHERFKHHSSFWQEFYDQASWYSLAGIKRHSDISFWELPNNGWHTDKNDSTVYSLEELQRHVELLPTSWNVTEMPGESSCQFNINRCKPKDVILRHFAGGQPWREKWVQSTTFHA